MTPEQAVTEIRNMIFRPGWTLGAQVLSGRRIYVYAGVETVDTSYADAGGTFYRPITLRPEAIIDVSGLDRAGLCRAILAELIQPMNEHEDREFLQVRTANGRWSAPLHPHTEAGARAWEAGLPERAARTLAEMHQVLERAA